MPYVFDTSALIGAWVRLYPPDLFVGFWENMDSLAGAGGLKAPEEVLEELQAQDDDLCKWVKDRADVIIVPTSRSVMLEARDVLADHPFLVKSGTGRGKADPFVIATASSLNMPVVTQEQGGSAEKPRIPYVCRERDVDCMAVLDVIRAENWTF